MSLRNNDLPSHTHLNPWLASLFAIPSHQNRGYGELLVKEALKKGQEFGYSKLYLLHLTRMPFMKKGVGA